MSHLIICRTPGDFAAALSCMREARGISAEEAARAISQSPKVVAGWETGTSVPHLHTTIRYARSLGYELTFVRGRLDGAA